MIRIGKLLSKRWDWKVSEWSNLIFKETKLIPVHVFAFKHTELLAGSCDAAGPLVTSVYQTDCHFLPHYPPLPAYSQQWQESPAVGLIRGPWAPPCSCWRTLIFTPLRVSEQLCCIQFDWWYVNVRSIHLGFFFCLWKHRWQMCSTSIIRLLPKCTCLRMRKPLSRKHDSFACKLLRVVNYFSGLQFPVRHRINRFCSVPDGTCWSMFLRLMDPQVPIC